MYQLATHPQSIAEILRDSFKLYKAAFMRLFFWAIVMGLINFLSAILTSTYLVNADMLQATESPGGLHLSFAFILIAVMILSLLPISAMMFDIYQVMNQQKPTIQSALMRALKTWLPLIGVLIICGLIMAVVAVVAFIIMVIIAKLFSTAIGIFCASIVFLGLIYIMVSLFAWYPLIITERQSVFPALKNSFKITKGNWWRTFFLLMIVFVVTALINVAVDFIFVGKFLPSQEHVQSLGQMLVNVFATVIFIPWLYAVILLQLHNLKLRRQKAESYEKALREYDAKEL